MSAVSGTLHVITASQRRGAEVFAADLVSALGASGAGSASSPRLVALTEGPGGNELAVPILGDTPFAPRTLRALRRAAREASVVVAHGSKTLPAVAAALVGSKVPFVYRSIGDPLAWSASGLRRVRTARLLRRAARVVALWPGAADTLASVHGVPRERLAVIPNGVPAARCPKADVADRKDARIGFGLPVDAPVVTYLGALTPEKAVDTAIAAVAGLSLDVRLLVAGAGPLRRSLGVLAAGTAPGQVHFAGRVEGPRQALAAADVVVLPSRTEGMPGVLIEAGLTGRAAVASDVGGVGAIVLPDSTGLLAPPGDVPAFTTALRTALANAPTWGEAAHTHCASTFEISVVAAQWSTLLTEVA
jgi:glycosyltransferase involved in cell wall biosynthesis